MNRQILMGLFCDSWPHVCVSVDVCVCQCGCVCVSVDVCRCRVSVCAQGNTVCPQSGTERDTAVITSLCCIQDLSWHLVFSGSVNTHAHREARGRLPVPLVFHHANSQYHNYTCYYDDMPGTELRSPSVQPPDRQCSKKSLFGQRTDNSELSSS